MNVTHGAGGRLVELPPFDCWRLLGSAEIARIAWHGPHGVTVVPVNYTIAEGALWFRTNPYSALARECGGAHVAVEVDSLDPGSRSGWSVVIRGVAELFEAQETPEPLAELRIWPAGVRNVFIRLEPAEVSGRKLLPAPESEHVGP